MSLWNRLGVAAVLAATVTVTPALADDCCGGAAKGGEAAGDSCGAGEKCCVAERSPAVEKATSEAIAKLDAPAPALSAEDAKAVAAARETLVTTCPVGRTLTRAIPMIAEAIVKARAVDCCNPDTVPAEYKNEDGSFAFCSEACGKLTPKAKMAKDLSEKSLARAEKLALKLAAIAAQPGAPTTKRAGAPAEAPGKEDYAKLAAVIENAVQDLGKAFEAAKTLPQGEAEKLEAAKKTIAKLSPGQGPAVLFPAYMALFAELDLASRGAKCAEKEMAGVELKLSEKGKLGQAFLATRGKLVAALGGFSALKPCCGAGEAKTGEKAEGGCCGGEKGGGCCGGDEAAHPAPGKPVNTK